MALGEREEGLFGDGTSGLHLGVRDALKAGAGGYILKPFTALSLKERLHSILRLPTELV